MAEHYETEILIIGGGPAGLAVASRLPTDLSAILVHQDREIGQPVRTSGGCWISDTQKLGLPATLAHRVNRADIYSDNEHFELDLSSNPMAVLDVTGLYRWLGEQSNAQVWCATKYLRSERKGSGFVSHLRREGREITIRSHQIVDASGWHCAALASLGLGAPPVRRGIGVEYEFDAPGHDSSGAALFFGSATPTGYGWAFPTRLSSLRLGVGVIHPVSRMSPKEVMHKFLESGALERMGLPEPTKFHVNSGILPSVAFTPNLVHEGVIRVGDSANMATPTLGEGIRVCIEQGRALGEALGQRSPVALKRWERNVRRKLALQYRIGFEANKRAGAYTPQDWDRSVARMRRLPADELVRFFRNDFTAGMIARRGAQAMGRKIRRALVGTR